MDIAPGDQVENAPGDQVDYAQADEMDNAQPDEMDNAQAGQRQQWEEIEPRPRQSDDEDEDGSCNSSTVSSMLLDSSYDSHVGEGIEEMGYDVGNNTTDTDDLISESEMLELDLNSQGDFTEAELSDFYNTDGYCCSSDSEDEPEDDAPRRRRRRRRRMNLPH